MSTNSNQLTDHAYDGIQEYDNPLPGWWTNLFIGSIVFSVLYMLYFHTGAPGRTLDKQLENAQTSLAKIAYKDLGAIEQNRESLLKMIEDKDWVLYGKSIYNTNCQTCHGPDGIGLVGPNLTDDRWKNIKHVEDIMTIINNGAAGNAMPAWKQRFASEPRDVIMVAAYVASLLETPNKPAGKGPDGANTIASWDADRAELKEKGGKPEATPPANAPAPSTKPAG